MMHPFLIWFVVLVGIFFLTTLIYLRDCFRGHTEKVTVEELKGALSSSDLWSGLNILAHLMWPITVCILCVAGIFQLVKWICLGVVRFLVYLINLGR